MVKKVKDFLCDESGQGMVEYGLIIAVVAIGAIVAMTLLGGQVNATFTKVKEALESALTPTTP